MSLLFYGPISEGFGRKWTLAIGLCIVVIGSIMACFGWVIMLGAVVLMLLGHLYIGMSAWVIFVPAMLFFIGATFIYPNASAITMTPFGKLAGYAGALYSFIQVASAAFFWVLISHLPDSNQLPLPLAVVFIVAALLCLFIYQGIVHRIGTD